jgi:hypothetical protein
MKIRGIEIPLTVLGAGFVTMIIVAVIMYKTQKTKIQKLSLPKKLSVIVGPAVAAGGSVMVGLFLWKRRKAAKKNTPAVTESSPSAPTAAPPRKKRRASEIPYSIRESPAESV